MLKKCLIPFLIAGTLLFSACTGNAYVPGTTAPSTSESEGATEATAQTVAETTAETTLVTEPPDAIATLLSEMTLREKVGQLFIVRPDSLDPSLSQAQIDDANADGVTELTDAMREMLKKYPVGGIVQFGKNIVSPEQISRFNDDLLSATEIPLFISVDEEGGLVARLANHKAFDLPKYKNAASIQTVDEAAEMGNVIGAYLRNYGFNMDFAPVADVNTNPDNPVIGTRAFSSDPEEAATLAVAMASGLNAQGITAVFKHFPGHGDTAEDSHSSIAVSYKSAEEMASCEWLAYRTLTDTDCVMVGHIATPEITGTLVPASLSHTLVTDILKGELGFEGPVITDSLSMGAITENYTPGEAAIAALEAGCDILLMPNGLAEAFEAVVSAVEDGTFPEETLDAIVTRILTFKQAQGLLS